MAQFGFGNRFWEARTTIGRPALFTDPEVLWAACVEYFKWNDDHPLYEAKLVSYEGKSTLEQVPHLVPLTIGGLCLFLGIDQITWRDYRSKPAFSSVCTRAEEVIYRQKFAGAGAGFFNAAIIARDLGLADKKELSGPGGQAIPVDNTVRLDPEQLREVMKSVQDEC
jgi:hypothetical protein